MMTRAEAIAEVRRLSVQGTEGFAIYVAALDKVGSFEDHEVFDVAAVQAGTQAHLMEPEPIIWAYFDLTNWRGAIRAIEVGFRTELEPEN